MLSRRWLFSWALISIAVPPLGAQAVISARSGVIHFSDGSVFLDNQNLEHRFGKFEQMKEGSDLRTESGRAEVLLTPGVFLRVGENSAIRMISNRLADTRVEFLSGSIMLDSVTASESAPITILYGAYQTRIQKPGRYRFNSDPPELRVKIGEIEVFSASDSARVTGGYGVSLSGELVTRRFADDAADGLDSWNGTRNSSISENNLTAAGTSDLSTVVDGWQNDPDALLRALVMSTYAPPLSSRTPLSTYAPLSIYPPSSSIYSPLSTYSPLVGSPATGLLPFGIWGLGFGSPYGIYSPPLVRYVPYPAVGTTYRPLLTPGRPIIGVSPTYPTTPRPSFQPVAPIGGGRFGRR
jgi:hypothetical protein